MSSTGAAPDAAEDSPSIDPSIDPSTDNDTNVNLVDNNLPTDALEFTLNLFQSIHSRSLPEFTQLLHKGHLNSYPWIQDNHGRTPLHLACLENQWEMVELLLEAGHPWNAVDDEGRAAAQLTTDEGLYWRLVEEGVRVELLMNCLQSSKSEQNNNENEKDGVVYGDEKKYLDRAVEYKDNALLVDDEQNAVMMDWERGIMQRHAHYLVMDRLIPLDNMDKNKKTDNELLDVPLVHEWDSHLPNRHSLTHFITNHSSPLPPALEHLLNSQTNNDDNDEDNDEELVIMNVGFGLGIVDAYIHQYLCYWQRVTGRRAHHVIIEAHPTVLEEMRKHGWISSDDLMMNEDGDGMDGEFLAPRLTVLAGRWQDHIPATLLPDIIEEDEYETEESSSQSKNNDNNNNDNDKNPFPYGLQFDGIFFDTFGEDYHALKQFHDHLPNLLKSSTSDNSDQNDDQNNDQNGNSGARYSFFNGLGGRNPYFHDVYCRIVQMDLEECGLECEFQVMDVHIKNDQKQEDDKKEEDDAQQKEVDWTGVKRSYFELNEYRLPKCRLMNY